MTAPQSLIADQSGLYSAPANMGPLRARAGASGAAWLEADLASVQNKSRLLELLAAAGGFPATFGANWDALADSLQDLSWQPAGGYVLHLRDAAGAARALGADWSTVLEILGRTATYWKERGKPFVVLVDDARGLPAFK